MRILHLDAGAWMRGGQLQVLRLIEGLTAERAESTLMAPANSALARAARARGLRVEPIGIPAIYAAARRHDLVHAHDAHSHTLAAVLGSAPLVVARRVAFPVGLRWKYRRPRHYIAVSEFVKRVLTKGGVPPEKISVIPAGVPLLEPSQGSRVLALGDFVDLQKGTGIAIQAAWLAGVDLLLTRNLEADLARASAFVYISYSEGLGSAALLAMSAGVPVIASKAGGLPEAVRDGETGLLVDNDAASVAMALNKLTGEPELARRMGEAGRRAVLENFTVELMVRRTMEVYRTVLA